MTVNELRDQVAVDRLPRLLVARSATVVFGKRVLGVRLPGVVSGNVPLRVRPSAPRRDVRVVGEDGPGGVSGGREVPCVVREDRGVEVREPDGVAVDDARP